MSAAVAASADHAATAFALDLVQMCGFWLLLRKDITFAAPVRFRAAGTARPSAELLGEGDVFLPVTMFFNLVMVMRRTGVLAAASGLAVPPSLCGARVRFPKKSRILFEIFVLSQFSKIQFHGHG